MEPALYTVRYEAAGSLSTMAKPRGDDWLDDEMRGLRAAGVDVLVCALTPDERDEVGLSDESEAAQRAGLEFRLVPIRDRGVPDAAAVLPLLRDLADQFRDGRHIVTHCRFGIGRSSLLAASILVLNGLQPAQAWQLISDARGYDVPDTRQQRLWVDDLYRQLIE